MLINKFSVSKPNRITESTESNEIRTSKTSKCEIGKIAADFMGVKDNKGIIFADIIETTGAELVSEFGDSILKLKNDAGNLVITDINAPAKVALATLLNPTFDESEVYTEEEAKGLDVKTRSSLVQTKDGNGKKVFVKASYDIEIDGDTYRGSKITNETFSSSHTAKLLEADSRMYNTDGIAIDEDLVKTGENYLLKIKSWVNTGKTVNQGGIDWFVLIFGGERRQILVKKKIGVRGQKSIAKQSIKDVSVEIEDDELNFMEEEEGFNVE